jgi:hypothetical protein
MHGLFTHSGWVFESTSFVRIVTQRFIASCVSTTWRSIAYREASGYIIIFKAQVIGRTSFRLQERRGESVKPTPASRQVKSRKLDWSIVPSCLSWESHACPAAKPAGRGFTVTLCSKGDAQVKISIDGICIATPPLTLFTLTTWVHIFTFSKNTYIYIAAWPESTDHSPLRNEGRSCYQSHLTSVSPSSGRVTILHFCDLTMLASSANLEVTTRSIYQMLA